MHKLEVTRQSLGEHVHPLPAGTVAASVQDSIKPLLFVSTSLVVVLLEARISPDSHHEVVLLASITNKVMCQIPTLHRA